MAKTAKILPLEDPPSLSSTEDERDSDSEEPESSPVAATPLKKRKREGTSTEVNTKKAKTQRGWSEENEITLLQRLIDFHAVKGTNPFEDKQHFFDFVQTEITFEVSQSQVERKIRFFKEKYIGTANRRVRRSFLEPHDKECLRLSKCIWGSGGKTLLTSKHKEVFSHSSRGNHESNEVLSLSSGRDNKVVEEGVSTPNGEDQILAAGGSGSKVVESEVLARAAGGSGTNEELAPGVGGSGDKVVENLARGAGEKVVEKEPEGLACAAGHSEALGVVRDPEWFEKSALFRSIRKYGVAEHTVKERWSMLPEEKKKKVEEDWKSLEAKHLRVVSQMIKYKSELASKFAKAT